jgi:hypothetical protein
MAWNWGSKQPEAGKFDGSAFKVPKDRDVDDELNIELEMEEEEHEVPKPPLTPVPPSAPRSLSREQLNNYLSVVDALNDKRAELINEIKDREELLRDLEIALAGAIAAVDSINESLAKRGTPQPREEVELVLPQSLRQPRTGRSAAPQAPAAEGTGETE